MKRRRTWKASAWMLMTLLLLAVGCQRTLPTRAHAVNPPAGWEEQLTAMRAAKDRQFRLSPGSPVPEAKRGQFEGLDYWDPVKDYYFIAPMNWHAQPQRFQIISTAGTSRPCEKIGWIEIPFPEGVRSLQVYRLLDQPVAEQGGAQYFLPFQDSTTGQESYPAGRYIELNGPPSGPFVIDFNQASNPSCAYGDADRFACPVTPAENRLDVPVRVGERGFVHDPLSPA